MELCRGISVVKIELARCLSEVVAAGMLNRIRDAIRLWICLRKSWPLTFCFKKQMLFYYQRHNCSHMT